MESCMSAERDAPAIDSSASGSLLDFHHSAIVVDTHVDTILRQLDLGHDLTASASPGYMDLPRMKKGNLTAAFFACCVDYNNIKRGTARLRQQQIIDAILDLCARNGSIIELARSAADVRRLAAAGKLAAVLTIEGAQAIEDDLASLQSLWDQGVRSIALAHFTTNGWADSSADVERHGGLSALGRKAVAELNRLGMIIDVSHASDRATLQAIDASSAPVLASHSSARALHNHPRNLTDELIRAIAARGGVIGPTLFPEYIFPSFQVAMEEHAAAVLKDMADRDSVRENTPAIATVMRSYGSDMHGKYNSLVTRGLPMPSLGIFVQHVAHVAELVSPQHVCIGTDHGAVRFDIPRFEDCTKLPALTEALLAAGFSRPEVEDILGGNVLRLMEQVIGA
jgi:membrane dipeptidase